MNNKVIEVTRTHSMPVDQAKAKANDVATRMQASLGIRWQWSTPQMITFDVPAGIGKGCNGMLEVTEQHIKVTINLPMLLAMMPPMRSSIEEGVKEELDAAGVN